MKVKVTIGFCVKNAENVVKDAIESIVKQDYPHENMELLIVDGCSEKNPYVGIGRAIYGILLDSNLIAFLENIPFVVECLKHPKDVPLGICGTEGAIYRVEAVKQAGGFDTRIKGAAEDTDLAERIKKLGWSACLTNAIFYEKCKDTWKTLFNQYIWWGYGGYYRFRKTKNFIELLKMTPMAGFLAGLLRFPIAYKLTRRKSLLLLPFHYSFKRIAWFIGFFRGHLDDYS